MKTAARLELVLLVFDSVLLAVFELVFLLLRFDGTLLPDLGGWPFPITALIAAVTVPLLVRRASQLSPSLLLAGAPLFAWLTVVLLGLVAGPGGDTLLLPDWRTLLLAVAGVVPGTAALGKAV